MNKCNTNFDDLFDVDTKTGIVRIKGTDKIVPSLRYDQKLGEIRSYGIKSFEKRSIPVDGDTKPDRETLIEVNGKLTDWDGSDILKTVDHHTNYRISTLGYIMNSRGMIMSSAGAGKDRKHQAVCLSENGKQRMHYIHRLVADAFIPNPDNLPVVHHIDGNPLNNRVDNLMWMSVEDHNKIHEADRNRGTKANWKDPEYRDKVIAGVKSNWKDPEFRERHRAATKEANSITVEMCNPDTLEVIQTFASVSEAARITGFDLSSISKACNGKYSTNKGHIYKDFYWRFKQD